jgi:transposase
MRARHRLSKLLLRHGAVWDGKEAWTTAHEAWLRRQAATFTGPGQRGLRAAFDADHEAVLMAVTRRDRLDAAIEEMAADSQFTPVVRRLGCLRGVNTLTAFGLAVEIGHWHRFSGATIGAYLGLVPSEHSSGASRVQGSITKTGNTHARRLLVEAAWHHKRTYRVPGATMQARWKAFTARKKRPVIANVAVARELAGWCWSLAVLDC